MRTAILSLAMLVPLAAAAAADPAVSGKVTLNGKPLFNGTVTFLPADPKAKPIAAKIEPDGTYQVKDVPPGEYKVGIDSTIEKKDPKDPKGTVRVSIVPQKYTDPKTSGITATIKKGENAVNVDLNLASR